MGNRVAVVLSGGGAKGAYEAGALRPIVQACKNIRIITGASIGAINAAVFAVTYNETDSLLDAVEAVQEAWINIGPVFNLNVRDILTRSLISGLGKGDLSVKGFLSFSSLVGVDRIEKMIAELIPDKRISDLHRIDLAINATDLTTGKVVTFDRNNDLSIREAVLASSCIPLLFPTRRIDGNYYVDGGVFNNTPLKDALVLGATDVFVVALKPRDTEVYRQCIVDVTSYNSVYSTALRLMELIMDKIMYEDLKQARKLNEVIRVIEELDRRGEASLASDLKRAIGYEKHGRVKSIVGFHEVAPTCRLDPPGTLGFDDKKSIIGLIKMGEADGRAQLDGVLIAS